MVAAEVAPKQLRIAYIFRANKTNHSFSNVLHNYIVKNELCIIVVYTTIVYASLQQDPMFDLNLKLERHLLV